MVETSHPQQDCKLNPLGHTDQIFRVGYNILIQEISNGRTHGRRTHGPRTPNKAQYLITLISNLLIMDLLGFIPIQFLMEMIRVFPKIRGVSPQNGWFIINGKPQWKNGWFGGKKPKFSETPILSILPVLWNLAVSNSQVPPRPAFRLVLGWVWVVPLRRLRPWRGRNSHPVAWKRTAGDWWVTLGWVRRLRISGENHWIYAYTFEIFQLQLGHFFFSLVTLMITHPSINGGGTSTGKVILKLSSLVFVAVVRYQE